MNIKSKTFTLSEIDFNLLASLQEKLGVRSCSAILSMALRALNNSFLPSNSNILESPSIPSLPGMTEAVIKSQMQRFNLSSDEYQTIVRDLVDRCAASKTPIKNPEGMIFGACKRYAAERDAKKDGGQPQKDGGNKPSWLEIQDAQN